MIFLAKDNYVFLLYIFYLNYLIFLIK